MFGVKFFWTDSILSAESSFLQWCLWKPVVAQVLTISSILAEQISHLPLQGIDYSVSLDYGRCLHHAEKVGESAFASAFFFMPLLSEMKMFPEMINHLHLIKLCHHIL